MSKLLQNNSVPFEFTVSEKDGTGIGKSIVDKPAMLSSLLNYTVNYVTRGICVVHVVDLHAGVHFHSDLFLHGHEQPCNKHATKCEHKQEGPH